MQLFHVRDRVQQPSNLLVASFFQTQKKRARRERRERREKEESRYLKNISINGEEIGVDHSSSMVGLLEVWIGKEEKHFFQLSLAECIGSLLHDVDSHH